MSTGGGMGVFEGTGVLVLVGGRVVRVDVGLGVFVGGTGVRVEKRVAVGRGWNLVAVGLIGPILTEVGVRGGGTNEVRVGRGVSVNAVRSLGVPLTKRSWVAEAVKVAVGVKEGVAETSRVAVGVKDGVRVGRVEVGKGPSSACEVPAMAVFILSTSLCVSSLKPKTLPLLKIAVKATNTNPMHKTACSRICR